MMRETWDRWSPLIAAVGALGGILVSLAVFGVLQADPLVAGIGGEWLVRLYIAPAIPAFLAFLGAMCLHPAPRGWPFVRSSAAIATYLSFTSGVFAYDSVGRYARYATFETTAWFVLLPIGLSTAAPFLVTWSVHRRVVREASLEPKPVRNRFLLKVLGYHLLATLYGIIAIPQLVKMSSRGALYVVLFLPIPFFLFFLGSIRWFSAAATSDLRRARGDITSALLFHAFPLFLMGLFAVQVVGFMAVFGGFTWRDPYYQVLYTDYTLPLTPILGAVLVLYLILFLKSELRHAPYAASVPPSAA